MYAGEQEHNKHPDEDGGKLSAMSEGKLEPEINLLPQPAKVVPLLLMALVRLPQ